MIEPAQPHDLDALVQLLADLHRESPRYSALTFSPDRVRATLAALIDAPQGLVLVAREKGRGIVGMIAAVCEPAWMSTDEVAQELVFVMRPGRRGSFAATRLASSLIAWARLRGARRVEVGTSTGIATDRTVAFYEFLGFRRAIVGLDMEI